MYPSSTPPPPPPYVFVAGQANQSLSPVQATRGRKRARGGGSATPGVQLTPVVGRTSAAVDSRRVSSNTGQGGVTPVIVREVSDRHIVASQGQLSLTVPRTFGTPISHSTRRSIFDRALSAFSAFTSRGRWSVDLNELPPEPLNLGEGDGAPDDLLDDLPVESFVSRTEEAGRTKRRKKAPVVSPYDGDRYGHANGNTVAVSDVTPDAEDESLVQSEIDAEDAAALKTILNLLNGRRLVGYSQNNFDSFQELFRSDVNTSDVEYVNELVARLLAGVIGELDERCYARNWALQRVKRSDCSAIEQELVKCLYRLLIHTRTVWSFENRKLVLQILFSLDANEDITFAETFKLVVDVEDNGEFNALIEEFLKNLKGCLENRTRSNILGFSLKLGNWSVVERFWVNLIKGIRQTRASDWNLKNREALVKMLMTLDPDLADDIIGVIIDLIDSQESADMVRGVFGGIEFNPERFEGLCDRLNEYPRTNEFNG